MSSSPGMNQSGQRNVYPGPCSVFIAQLTNWSQRTLTTTNLVLASVLGLTFSGDVEQGDVFVLDHWSSQAIKASL